MIDIERANVYGFEAAIRGMRNPMNSWDKSDSHFIPLQWCETDEEIRLANMCYNIAPVIGNNDLELMKKLSKSGTDHSKYLRMIGVTFDITAPLYWWKEFDTYKVGTVANSCSTMHKVTEHKFTRNDFSCEHLDKFSLEVLDCVIKSLNISREDYLEDDKFHKARGVTKKDDWWQIIQLLPSSFNQKRTVSLNYQVLMNQYHSRKQHKLDEWRNYCKFVETLPYFKEICIDTKEK